MPTKAFRTMRDITILQSATFAFMIGIASIILLDKGLDLETLGLWVMFASASVLILEVPTGAFADAYGRRKALIAGFFFEFLFLAGLLWAPNTIVLMGIAFVGALGDSLMSGSKEAHVVSILSERGKEGYTHRVLSSGFGWQHMTFIVGSIIGGYIATFSIDYALLLCMAFALLGVLYSIFNLSEKREKGDFADAESDMLSNMRQALQQALDNASLRMLFFLSLMFGLAAFGLFNYWQPVMRDIAGWDNLMLGAFFSLISIMVIIGSRISPHLKADWNTVMLGNAASAVLLFIAGWASPLPLIIASLLLWQVLLGINGPLGAAIVNANTPEAIRATVLSIGALCARLGMFLFGVLVLFIGADEPRVFWMIGAGFLLLGALAVLAVRGAGILK